MNNNWLEHETNCFSLVRVDTLIVTKMANFVNNGKFEMHWHTLNIDRSWKYFTQSSFYTGRTYWEGGRQTFWKLKNKGHPNVLVYCFVIIILLNLNPVLFWNPTKMLNCYYQVLVLFFSAFTDRCMGLVQQPSCVSLWLSQLWCQQMHFQCCPIYIVLHCF